VRNDCTVGKLSERNESDDEEVIRRRSRSCADEPHSVLPMYSRVLVPLGNERVNASRATDIT